MSEPLTPSDLSAIQAERGPVHMHVGGVAIFDGPVTRETVVQRLRERIHLIPRYAMRLEEAPLGLANPVWSVDDRFDPGRHVRRVGLPTPGGDAELCELAGEILSERLDRERPLWQMTLVEGLARGRTALVAKMHHALVDGLAAVDVSTVILDPTPEGLDVPPPEAGAPSERRLARRLEPLTRLAAAQMNAPRKLVRDTVARTLSLDPRVHARQAREAAGVMRELTKVRSQAPDTRLNAEIGRDRLFAIGRARLDDVKAVARAAGSGKVNDVLLAAVSLALEDFLGPAGPDRAVALVPVSVRADDERGELGNRISTVFVDLPLRGEPLDRVRSIAADMDRIKRSPQVQAGSLIVGAIGLAPPVVSSVVVRAMSGPRLFNLVVSNIPGPQQTFYLAGTPLHELFPAVPLNPRNQALSIGIVSYDGGVRFGILADRDAIPDVADLGSGVQEALAGLVAAAAAGGRAEPGS